MIARLAPGTAYRPMDPVLRRLRALARLSEADLDLLLQLSDRRVRHGPGDELIAEGEMSHSARFIVSGWASTHRVLADGRRQIFSVSLPGDGGGVYPRQGAPALCGVTALTALESVDAGPVLEAVREGSSPGLALALTVGQRVE